MKGDQLVGETGVEESRKKWSERNWFGKACVILKYIRNCALIIFLGGAIIVTIQGVYEENVKTWIEEHKVCVEWRESFPDRRLIEIVRKDVDGQTFDEIGDFYGVSGGCIEKRINEDRELFERLRALYISRNY